MTRFHVHLVSDSTGGTLSSLAKACLAQFDETAVEQHFWPLMRSAAQLEKFAAALKTRPGLVLYTLVDEKIEARIADICRDTGSDALPVLQPVMTALARQLGRPPRAEPGVQHKLNAEYFARMEAVDFALHHDDGQKGGRDLASADVILVGVSRTSKTPTSVYLAHRGVRAANIPWVPGVPFPEAVLQLAKPSFDAAKPLSDAAKPLFVALTAQPSRLIEIRRNRLQHLGEGRETDYLAAEAVEAEVLAARRFYAAQGWPVIDVTRRSVEETAAEIMALLARRQNEKTPHAEQEGKKHAG